MDQTKQNAGSGNATRSDGEGWRGNADNDTGHVIGKDELDRLFSYRESSPLERSREKTLSDGARAFSTVLVNTCPPSRQLDQAIEQLGYVVSLGRMGIANAGRSTRPAD